MTDQLAGGVAKVVDVVIRPLINALVFALPIVYVVVAVVDAGSSRSRNMSSLQCYPSPLQ